MSESNEIYLDTNILQKDMRIRIPKQVLQNLNAIPGESYFDIFIESESKRLILKIKEGDSNKS